MVRGAPRCVFPAGRERSDSLLSLVVPPTHAHTSPAAGAQERHPPGPEAGDQAHAAEQAAPQRGARGPARHRGHAGPCHRQPRWVRVPGVLWVPGGGWQGGAGCVGRCVWQGVRGGGGRCRVACLLWHPLHWQLCLHCTELPPCPPCPHPCPPTCPPLQASTLSPLCRSSAPSPLSCETSSTPAA